MNFENENKIIDTNEAISPEEIVQPDKKVEKPKILETPDDPEAVASTDTSESFKFNLKKPENLGKGEYGFEGAVFRDGVKRNGTELTVREKNIIEAHEKGHGLRDFVSEDGRDFRQSIDFEVIRQKDAKTGVREIGYLKEPDEIAERMSQLKNYFGFKAQDVFTKEHLEYAKQNYLKDIPFDNNMSTFFEAITDFTVDKFLETINKYPL